MANLVYIEENQLINAPSINLMPQFAMFNDAFTWNVLSGTATATNLNQNQLEGDRCLRIVPDPTTGAVVNSGGTQMQVTVPADGDYIFSIKHQCNFPASTLITAKVKIYVNAVATDYSFSADADNNDQYRTYYQIIPNLLSGDVVDFAFEFSPNGIGGSYKNYFDAPKFEFDNFGLGIPTTFSLPQEGKTTVAINIPSIASLGTQTLTATVTGADVLDFISMTYPAALITSGLVVGYPIVSATDTVSFIVYNPTGGAVDPASADFTFKIIR